MKVKSHRGITEVFFSIEKSVDLVEINCDYKNDIFIVDENIESLFYSVFKIDKSKINYIYLINPLEESKDIKFTSKLIENILKSTLVVG